jgi:hypothetical protein
LCGAAIVNEAHHSRSFWYTFPSRFSDLCGMIERGERVPNRVVFNVVFTLRMGWGFMLL